MVFSELTSEQQIRALSDLVRFLAENNCSSLDAAAARLGQSPQQIWTRLLSDAGAPETEIPRDKIGARSSRRGHLYPNRAALLGMLQRPEGVCESEALAATGWRRRVGTLRRTAHETGSVFIGIDPPGSERRYYAVAPDGLDDFQRSHADEPIVETARPNALRLNATRVAGVTLPQVIAAGFLKPPLNLEAHHNGTRLTAVIQADGSVLFDGRPFPSPSSAGSAATGELACPGWAFWKICDPETGEREPLNEFRQLYLDNIGG